MYILWNTNVGMLNMISLKCVHWGPVDHDKESVLSGNDTYVVPMPQWVNIELIGGALSGMVVVIPVQHFKRVGPKANDIFSIKTEFTFEKCMVNDACYLLQTASADSCRPWGISSWTSAYLTHWGRDKCPPFPRRHFQMHFLEWKYMNSD